MSDRPEQYLSRKKKAAKGDEADLYQRLEQLYIKKLWYELANEVKKVVYTPPSSLDLKEFYSSFISEFEHRINLLQLAEISIPIANYIFNTDRDGALAFLEKMGRTVKKDVQAKIRVDVGQIKLRLDNKDKSERCIDIDTVRGLIESTRKEMDEKVHGVQSVHVAFYKVSSVYYKEIGDYASYYREALRYLGVEDLTSLTTEEKHVHAVLLGFAALLGENIYNLGELLAHPILNSLENTNEVWIKHVLDAFNEGNLDKFNTYERQWSEWDDLKRRKAALINKIRLLALMELALQRSSKNRQLTFAEIAKSCQIDLEKVEHLVMRALSKKLIRGSIDQVNGLVLISWVQPRVLNEDQLRGVSKRINEWTKDVCGMENLVAANARDILTKA
ncbi:hypothetical protein PFISCL1PPCAC_6181 [Pristionchus fissidentatus]|uniref:26S proteasome non-ATPase regulatory subunit 13 n=1 Tax=Pristionchus fissidentatus TaxID=1538716 RepID=A0AAV5V625_9BILA|nr:hypothetical protein PFISCL1PPCAC_6181 [Pristionchus fissidentatus]